MSQFWENTSKKMYKLFNILSEIRIIPGSGKLKAFQNPSGAIYLIFNGKDENSTHENYINKIGWIDKKDNKVKFELTSHTIESFIKMLNSLRIPFTKEDETGEYIGIDLNRFNIKPINKWTLYDNDIEKTKWFNYNGLNEIKIVPGGDREYNANNLKNPQGKDLKVGDVVYFKNGDFYQKTNITKITKRQTGVYGVFYYKIYVSHPDVEEYLVLWQTYVKRKRNLDEIKLINPNNITPESVYSLTLKLFRNPNHTIKDNIINLYFDMGYDIQSKNKKTVEQWVKSLDINKLAEIYFNLLKIK